MSDPISALYDAAVGEEDWSRAVELVARTVGASTLILGVGNPRRPEDVEIFHTGWDDSFLVEAGYSRADVWNPTINPSVAAGLIMPVGRSMHIREIVPEDTLGRSHFEQATTVRQGLANTRLYVPLRDGDLLAGGFFAKGPRRDFDADEIPGIDRVVPHIGRALRLRAQVDRHRSAERNLGAVLDNLAYGVMLLDRSGEVVLMNARCETLVRRGEGISVVRRRPRLGPEAEAAIAAALAVVDLGTDRFPWATGVRIPCSAGKPPYLARLFPAIGLASLGGAGTVRVALTIDDRLGSAALPDPRLLRDFFGLSQAEVAVAQLMTCMTSRRAMADHLHLSENTVKTHLASIREKTAAASTSEAALIIARATLAPPFELRTRA